MTTHIEAAEAELAAFAPTEDLTEEEAPRKERLPIGAWLAAGWLALISAAAFLAPWLPLPDYDETNLDILGKGPLDGSLLGADSLGYDVFSRCIWGARTSLLIGFGAVILGLVVGGTLGLFAGYFKSRIATVLSSLFDILLAFPQLVLSLTLVAVLAPDPSTSGERTRVLIITLGIVSVPVLGRITRANTLAWSQREFVMAAKSQGATDRRIIWREVLPNVLPAMLSIAMLGVAVVIVIEGALSILGVSVPSSTPSWGNIIASAQGDMESVPHAIFAPCAFIFLTVLSLNYLGDVIRSRFDVRESVL
jgi:peptide/nickel transport system permease protein